MFSFITLNLYPDIRYHGHREVLVAITFDTFVRLLSRRIVINRPITLTLIAKGVQSSSKNIVFPYCWTLNLFFVFQRSTAKVIL